MFAEVRQEVKITRERGRLILNSSQCSTLQYIHSCQKKIKFFVAKAFSFSKEDTILYFHVKSPGFKCRQLF